MLTFALSLGIDTAKHSADHLDIYLLHALNKMLEDNGYHESKYPEAVRSSELNLDQLKHVIKETYYQLDQNLRRMVKDESGCVCVSRAPHSPPPVLFLS